jgi:hypothetical protein
MKGITTEIIDPLSRAEGAAHVVDLYVDYEGLEALRDNTTRPYSEWFDGLIKKVDAELADMDGEAADQPTLPGLEDLD